MLKEITLTKILCSNLMRLYIMNVYMRMNICINLSFTFELIWYYIQELRSILGLMVLVIDDLSFYSLLMFKIILTFLKI